MHRPGVVDLRDRLVGRSVFGPAGDVFVMAVAEVRAHDELLLRRPALSTTPGGRISSRSTADRRLRPGGAGGDPLGQDAILERIDA